MRLFFNPHDWTYHSEALSPYPANVLGAIRNALSEGWDWLMRSGLLVPSEQRNGFVVLSRRAEAIKDGPGFTSFRRAADFPKALLHSAIADRVWLMLLRREFDTAVFHSFREVEIAVREVGGYTPADLGADLMRKAFNPNTGPLTDMQQHMAEREALQAMFAGAIGSYKNPHSHRRLQIDAEEAQEMVVLASHLLRIVDSRRAAIASSDDPPGGVRRSEVTDPLSSSQDWTATRPAAG